MRISGLLALWALFVLVPADTVAAAPLKLITGPNLAPYTGEDLEGGGLAAIIVRRAFANVGYESRVSFAPWKRGYQQTVTGEFDATFPYLQSEDRKREMIYSEPVLEVTSALFFAKDRPIAFGSVEDLAGKTACQPLGYAMPPAVETLLREGRLKHVQPDGMDACGLLIASGRADFVIEDGYVTSLIFQRIGVADRVVMNTNMISHATLHLIAGKSAEHQALIDAFNLGLARLRESGEYDRLLAAGLPTP